MSRALILSLLSLNLMGCGYDKTDLPGGGSLGENPAKGGGNSGVGFNEVSAQVFQPHCLRCHSTAGGDRAGVNLETYTNVKRFIAQVESTVSSGAMPPRGGLAVEAKAVLLDWIRAGAPEIGTAPPTTSPPPATPPTAPPTPPPCRDDDRPQRHGDDCDDDHLI